MTTFTGTTGNDTADAVGGTLIGFVGGTLAELQDAFGDEILGLDGADTVVGGTGDDVIRGGAGNDQIDGGSNGAGGDTADLSDATGNITLTLNASGGASTGNVAGSGSDTLSNIENVIGGQANDRLTGNASINVLTGGAGGDTLDGGAGLDTLIGGSDNDFYYLWDENDVVIDTSGAGDVILSTISRNLSHYSGIEQLTLLGSSNINGIGNTEFNVIRGNSGNNILDGGENSDYLFGGEGNDILRRDNIGDLLSGGTGIDTVESVISTTIRSESDLENITLLGASSINATGNLGANVLIGNSGANVLDGLGGSDRLIGGLGDDTYVVYIPSDIVVEAVGQGIDKLIVAGEYVLRENVSIELLQANEHSNPNEVFSVTGNSAANTIRGSSYGDMLNGAAGNDVINGSGGFDRITGGSGDDIIVSGVSVSEGTAGDDLSGNTGNDTITGSSNNDTLNGGDGNDTLNGSAGRDAMTGGLGNDVYYYDNVFDQISESANGGLDLVRTLISITSLFAHVENAQLNGTGNFLVAGNTLNNTINGNSGINQLRGLDGNDLLFGFDGVDTLLGGAGRDQMAGGNGNDAFHFDSLADLGDTAATRDVITDFTVASDDLDFNTMDANSVAAGNQNFTWRGTGAFTAAGQLRYIQSGGNTIVQGNLDNNLATVEFEVQLNGLKALTAADIIV